MTMTVNVMASKWREAYDEQRCLSACIARPDPRVGFTHSEELKKISLRRLAGSPSRHPWIHSMKASRIPRFALAFFVSATLIACGSGPGDTTGSTCPTTSTLTYANFGQAFVQQHCLACHSANGPESPKFDTLAQIRSSSSDIDRSAAAGLNAVNTYMPERGSVDESERRKLGEWLACGAPE